ncbi:MAG TPA: DUF4232 domain-containing protein [Chloroflexota bacterium]
MKATLCVALMIGAALLPAGNGGRVSSVDAAQSAQAAPTCRNIQLLIRAQSSQGAAGHIAILYRIHNLTGQACTLRGYPGVQLLDRNFLSLPTTVRRGGFLGVIPVRVVRLRGHGNAYFALSYSDVPINNQPCRTAYYLMIFAPNNFLPVVTYAFNGGIMACAGNVDVSPVTHRPRF